MNDAELFANWYLWLVIAAVIIVAAAVLLIAVQFEAKRILTLAVAALGLVKQIRSNTQCVWKLADTNQTAGYFEYSSVNPWSWWAGCRGTPCCQRTRSIRGLPILI